MSAAMSDGSQSPRERARVAASRACVALARLFIVVALVEVAAAAARAVVEPEPLPTIVVHLGAIVRAGYAVVAALTVARWLPLSRALGVGPMVRAAVVVLGLSAALALLPFFDVKPATLSDALWDALLQLGRAAAFIAGACVALFVARTFAEREQQPTLARHLARSLVPLAMTAPIALVAIDPALAPSPWLAPSVALLVPVAMIVVGLMRWDVALGVMLAGLALGGVVLFGQAPGPLTLPAVALTAALGPSVFAAAGGLFELAPALGLAHQDTISRTFIRRMFEGTLGGAHGPLGPGPAGGGSARVGDLAPDEPEPRSEEEDDAEHLARAMRELGITPNPPRPAASTAPSAGANASGGAGANASGGAGANASASAGADASAGAGYDASAGNVAEPEPELMLPSVIAPLVPKSRTLARPSAPTPDAVRADEAEGGRLAPVVPLGWAHMHRGLGLVFASCIARVLLVTFGTMWSSSPIAGVPFVVALFDVAVLASSGLFALGMRRFGAGALPVMRPPARAALAFGVGLALVDAALVVTRFELEPLRPALLVTSAALGVLAMALLLVLLARSATYLRATRVAARARAGVALLAVWAVLGASTAFVHQLPDSDLQWLTFPLGFATAAVGLGAWIGLLWLIHDVRDALRP